MLAAPPSIGNDLTEQVEAARAALDLHPDDASRSLPAVRAIRYILVEACDGPMAAILADSAARLLGDDTGRLFS